MLNVGLIVDKHLRRIVFSNEFVDVLIAVGKKADKVARSARCKPIVAHVILLKAVEDTERIENASQITAKMIAVVFFLQPRDRFMIIISIGCRKRVDRRVKHIEKFILCNTAKRLITSIHANVVGLIEAAEHAHLRELGNSREHHEMEVFVGVLKYSIESFENITVVRLVCYLLTVISHIIKSFVVHHIKQGFVIFVN